MKRASIVSLVLALSLVAPSISRGDTHFEDKKDQAAYEETKFLCKSNGLQHFSMLGKLWLSAFSEAGIFPVITDAAKTKSFNQLKISKRLLELSSTDGYFQAVRECYGNDRFSETWFFVGLLAADISGKATAWAMDASMIRSLYYMSRTVLVAGAAEVPARFMWCRLVLRLAAKNRSILEKIADPMMMATLIASMVGSGHSDKAVENNVHWDQVEATDPVLKKIIQENAEYERMMATATPEEKKMLQFFIQKNAENLSKTKGIITGFKVS